MGKAIQFRNVSKQYRLGQVGTGTLSHDLQRAWARLLNKPDPFSTVDKIGSRRPLLEPAQPEIPNEVPGTVKAAKDETYIWALKDVTYEVNEGEIVGIIGRNGAGKSTLLKLLSRVTAPTIGQIRAKGRIASLLEVGTGFHPELTGRENIYLNGSILGMYRREITQKLDEIVEFSGCEKFIDTPVKRYSSGMTVRLGFAVAAHLDSEILIVDEVLAVGDAEFQKRCTGKMQEVSSKVGKTVLFVSHNMQSVSQLTNQCVWLERGRIKDTGDTSTIVERYSKESHAALSAVAAFPRDDSLPIVVRRVQVGDGGEIPRYERNAAISITIEYDVNQLLRGVHIACMIFRQNSCVLTSSDVDLGVHRLLEREPGRYRGSFKIPGGLLSEGEYSITVAAGIPFELNYDRATDVVAFEVFDDTSPVRKYLHRPHRGVLTQNIEWTVRLRNKG